MIGNSYICSYTGLILTSVFDRYICDNFEKIEVIILTDIFVFRGVHSQYIILYSQVLVCDRPTSVCLSISLGRITNR